MKNAGIVAAAGGSAVSLMPTIFYDTFYEGINRVLQLHTPDIGYFWDEEYDAITSPFLVYFATRFTTSPAQTSGSCRIMTVPKPASADCEVEVVVSAFTTNANCPINLIARQVDLLNCYALQIYGPTDTKDMEIVKCVNDTRTILGTYPGTNLTGTPKIRFTLIGSTLTAWLNDVLVLTVTDTTFSLAGGTGLGFGRVGNINFGANQMNSEWRVNTFRVGDFGALAPVPRTITPCFLDIFSESSIDTALTAHIPTATLGSISISGTSWTIPVNPNSLTVTVNKTSDYLTTTAGNPAQFIALSNPSPAVPDVNISTMIGGNSAVTNAPHVIIARYQDASNFYCAVIYHASNIADCQIWKMVAGVATMLGSVDANTTTFYDILFNFELVGTSLKLFREGFLILSVTDGSISATGNAGLGMGAVVVSTDQVVATQIFNNFLVREITGTSLWTPAMLSPAPILWFDAQDNASITKDGSNKVSQWNNKGSGGHAIQALAAGQPTYISSGIISGKPSIRFDGTANRMSGSLVMGGNTGTFLFFGTLATGGTTFASLVDMSNSGSALLSSGSFAHCAWLRRYTTVSARTSYNSSSSVTYSFTADVPFVVTVTRSPLSLAGYSNDGLIAATAQLATSIFDSNMFALGTNLPGSGALGPNYMAGDMFEVFLFSQELTLTNRNRLAGYLAHKWGQQALLPASHPYKVVPPRG